MDSHKTADSTMEIDEKSQACSTTQSVSEASTSSSRSGNKSMEEQLESKSEYDLADEFASCLSMESKTATESADRGFHKDREDAFVLIKDLCQHFKVDFLLEEMQEKFRMINRQHSTWRQAACAVFVMTTKMNSFQKSNCMIFSIEVVADYLHPGKDTDEHKKLVKAVTKLVKKNNIQSNEEKYILSIYESDEEFDTEKILPEDSGDEHLLEEKKETETCGEKKPEEDF